VLLPSFALSSPPDLIAAQICYILGGTRRSFVVDFGSNRPKRPHHRDSALTLEQSGDWGAFKDASTDTPNVLTGALVGGPGVDDAYADDRQDYKRNEVALDYNAALLLGTIEVPCALDARTDPAPLLEAAAAAAAAAAACIASACPARGAATDADGRCALLSIYPASAPCTAVGGRVSDLLTEIPFRRTGDITHHLSMSLCRRVLEAEHVRHGRAAWQGAQVLRGAAVRQADVRQPFPVERRLVPPGRRGGGQLVGGWFDAGGTIWCTCSPSD
jgi:Glycosyl hydrolase family 9